MTYRNWLQWTAVLLLTALIGLCVSWELWLAPLRPGGSWLVLKALPLLLPLFGILHGKIESFRWSALLVIAYFMEGVVRVYADQGLSLALAALEALLALSFFVSAFAFVRSHRADDGPGSKRKNP
jgi:uncharacterized membrane protein